MKALLDKPGRLVRSKRKTLAIEVRPDREVVVRAPLNMPISQIDAFLHSKRDWIDSHWHKPVPVAPAYTDAQEQALRQKALALLPPLVDRYAGILGVRPIRVTITSARTRFGSCSAKGSLCFSWRLLAYPLPAIEYVVLHELAHLKQLNHSPAFYALLARHMPDYRERAQLLKQPPAPIT